MPASGGHAGSPGRVSEPVRILDRYLLRQYLRIFLLCVLGVPFLFIVIDLTDSIDRFLAQGASRSGVFLHYLYQFPYWTLVAFPVSALLAAVFTISAMTRHFEITAAKASGVSFYRLAAPVLAAGLGMSLVALALTEVVPSTNRLAREALGDPARGSDTRLSFVYRGNEGRVYRVRRLDARNGRMTDIQIEREGTGFVYPTYKVTAPRAHWDSAAGRWVLEEGRIRFFPTPENTITLRFEELRQRAFTESPQDLLAADREPEEMNYEELGRFIESIRRSGGTPRDLEVDRALKIAYPFTCFIIVFFGAPLANSTRRGGATLSIGIALAITMVFLILIRLAQGLGAAGVLPPTAAAWLPNALFLTAGLALMAQVRT